MEKKAPSREAEGGSSFPETKKGRIFVYKTKGGLVPVSKVDRFSLRKKTEDKGVARAETQQLLDEQRYYADKDLVNLPYEPLAIIRLMENVSWFDACVRQIATDVIGSEYTIVPDPLAETKGTEEDRKRLMAFFEDPNKEEQTISDVLTNMVIDSGLVGSMAMEVSRDESGIIDGLYHLPAHTLRIHKGRQKYCQRRGTEYRWFKLFGESKGGALVPSQEAEDISSADGLPTNDPKLRAHEVIVWKNYWPNNFWYGMPPALSAVGSMLSLVGIRDYNLAFFENYGVPAAIVTLTGDWDADDVDAFSKFINTEIKRAENAHKTIVMNPVGTGEVDWTPLTSEAKEKEGHFKILIKMLRDEILAVFRMSPYRLGIAETGNLGGSTAEEATPVYISSVVNPIKRIVQTVMTQKVIRRGFGIVGWAFRLPTLDIRDMNRLVERAERLFGMSVLHRDAIREQIGKEPLGKAAGGEDYYLASTYAPLGAEGVAAGVAAQDQAIAKLKRDVDAALRKK